MGVETGFVAVGLVDPLVQGRQSRLGAVHDHKVPVLIYSENLDVVRLRDVEDLDGLKFGELVLLRVKLVKVGATEELSDNYQDVVVDQDRLATSDRLAYENRTHTHTRVCEFELVETHTHTPAGLSEVRPVILSNFLKFISM